MRYSEILLKESNLEVLYDLTKHTIPPFDLNIHRLIIKDENLLKYNELYDLINTLSISELIQIFKNEGKEWHNLSVIAYCMLEKNINTLQVEMLKVLWPPNKVIEFFLIYGKFKIKKDLILRSDGTYLVDVIERNINLITVQAQRWLAQNNPSVACNCLYSENGYYSGGSYWKYASNGSRDTNHWKPDPIAVQMTITNGLKLKSNTIRVDDATKKDYRNLAVLWKTLLGSSKNLILPADMTLSQQISYVSQDPMRLLSIYENLPMDRKIDINVIFAALENADTIEPIEDILKEYDPVTYKNVAVQLFIQDLKHTNNA